MTETDHHQQSSGGFVIHRRFDATAHRLYAAFVEPERLEHWFVVPGYTTPAARMRVDARPGGRMEAVMVADADRSEIPFSFEYVAIDAPHHVVLGFNHPREQVTITIGETGDGHADLSYELISWPGPANEPASRRGVEDMLDLIEAGISRGTI